MATTEHDYYELLRVSRTASETAMEDPVKNMVVAKTPCFMTNRRNQSKTADTCFMTQTRDAEVPTNWERKPAAEVKQAATVPEHLPSSGTVVLDVEQGGIVVPSFVGKSVRSAIELAEENGLDLEAVGSGLAREQSPVAGSHIPAGSRVTVRFGR